MNAKARILLDAFEALGDGAIVVEIGCIRFPAELETDGWSTVYLAKAALERGWEFYSVDHEIRAVRNALNALGDLPGVMAHDDGARWLRSFPDEIDGLYLDGSANPAETLEQYKAARLSQQAVVVVDDVQVINVDGALYEQGKGTLVLDVLVADGFMVTVSDSVERYQMAVATR